MPVIAARKLDYFVPSRCGARHANRAHRRFGAGADETHALERRQERADFLTERDFERARGAEARAALRGRRQGRCEARRRVSVNERPPRHHVVDEAVAVDVLEVRPLGSFDEQRRGADRLEGADGAVDAAGQDFLGAGEETIGLSRFHRRRLRYQNAGRRQILWGGVSFRQSRTSDVAA